ncbi:helix-turn-helix transcriptional regulator [Rhizobium sp. FKY42]|uniref:helix-turn-helix transcriptional regulator n=1 Tax=Rhizobium sp. FKY42 TaxID=2562310 RepID=UPI0010BFD2C5|nr:helix-turn-helix transcriptional regulator [Rhizobium sp. FKY42]
MTLNFEERLLKQAQMETLLPVRRASQAELADVEIDGDFRRLGIRDGLEVSIYDLILHTPFRRKVVSDAGLTMVFLTKAAGASLVRPCEGGVDDIRLDYDPRTAIMIYSSQALRGQYDVPANTRFSGVEIRATDDFLQRLDVSQTFMNAKNNHPLTLAANDAIWIGRFPITSTIEAILSQLMTSGIGQNRDDLSMEARSLDLLTASISVMREPLFCQKTKFLRDTNALLKAKTILLHNLDKAWTIHDLARQVGLSEKRLKEGFRQQFGLPVYSFLQKSRMEEARAILARQDSTVTEVALAVGYANPSRFSQLFLRQYGITPSMFKLQGEAAF